jgi:hypothetical protein
MGVKEGDDVRGYVEQTSLAAGRCKDCMKTFHPPELTAESTPLRDVFSMLRDAPRAFVLDRNKVVGIVTRGDLQKAPIRMWLFGLLTILEMHLLRLIRTLYPNDSWQAHLTKERSAKAHDLFSERKKRNEAIDLADCLQFCDKRKLVLADPHVKELVQTKYGDRGLEFAEDKLELAEKLRDKLAHAQDIVAGSSWQEIIDLVKSIEQFLEFFQAIR